MSDLRPGRYFLPVDVGEWRQDGHLAVRRAPPFELSASDLGWSIWRDGRRITHGDAPDLPSAMDAADAALAGLLVADPAAEMERLRAEIAELRAEAIAIGEEIDRCHLQTFPRRLAPPWCADCTHTDCRSVRLATRLRALLAGEG